MTPEQLKASVLQYAIQGRLVEQRPEEGTAEELLVSIGKKKEELINKVKAYAWDTYDVAGNSNMLHVVWQHNEIFEDLFPELANHLRYM